MNRTIAAAFATIAAVSVFPGAADAAKYKPLYMFCAKTNCSDGLGPFGAPVADGAGNYYGNTQGGGAKSAGTLYRMAFDGAHWKYTRLYSFCSQKKCADGSEPHGALVIDTMGNLYGTTVSGGAFDEGAVIELTPDGTLKVLYSFCALKDCADGALPETVTLSYRGAASGVAYDGSSPLFGTTSEGGKSNGGVVYSLTPGKTNWSEKVIHEFCAKDSCTDGGSPYTGVLVDGSGNLFGAAPTGGKYGRGALYELQKSGAKWSYALIHSFCADQSGCADGATPIAAPTIDGSGILYGTTYSGGAGAQGTVYKLVPGGSHSKLTTLHDFCMETACTDGANPFAGVVVDPAGLLFGTSYLGGDAGTGTIYRLSGAKLTSFTRLVSFGGTDTPGGAPAGGLMLDPSGALFGPAANGGSNDNAGVFFKYTP